MRYFKHAVLFSIFSVVAVVNLIAQEEKKKASEEKQSLDKLTIENELYQQKTIKKLRKLVDETEEIKVKYELMLQKQKLELGELDAEYKRLAIENKLSEEKRKKSFSEVRSLVEEKEKLSVEYSLFVERQRIELAKIEAEQKRFSLENKLREEKNKSSLADMIQANTKSKLENEALRERMQGLKMDNDKELMELNLEKQRLDIKRSRLMFEQEQIKQKTTKLATDLEIRAKKEEWESEANKEPEYPLVPFKDNLLIISDRRIPLNGPIVNGYADFVTERIHYFNNKSSEQPIFIVIDRCPGGSVMEGYRIIKAIKASKAPIHVVVKSYAASMAAVITTLADRSYAYPNAVILHHEMSMSSLGKMTQLKEQLEIAREWERRLHTPVAKKMGITVKAFRKKMYEKNSNGDWQEFADNAQKYKWVNSIVHEIRETGYIKKPDDSKKSKSPFSLSVKTDDKGRAYVTLPRLEPFDFYFIYNRDQYYR